METLTDLEDNKSPADSSRFVVLDLCGTLDFPHNEIVEQLCKTITTNKTLKHINLSHNSLQDEDVQILALALEKNNTLQSIDLSYNKLSDRGTTHLIYMLRENGNSKLKQIYLHNNAAVSPNTELLIWHIIASKQLPTALDMIDSKEQREQKQIDKIKILRNKLLILLNELQHYESRSRNCADIKKAVRGNIQKALTEIQRVDSDNQIQLLDCLSENSFSCELNSTIAQIEWVWKDSLIHDWQKCEGEIETFLHLEDSSPICPYLQHPLLHYVTKKMLVVILSPSGTTLQTLMAKNERHRLTQGTVLSNTNREWTLFSLHTVLYLLAALDYLHSNQLTLQVLSPRHIYVLTEQISEPQIRVAFLYGKEGRLKSVKKDDKHYLAPEVQRSKVGGGPAADIYSFGTIIQEMFLPYLGSDSPYSAQQIDSISSIIQNCTKQEPEERASIGKLKERLVTLFTSFGVGNPPVAFTSPK